MTHPANRRIVWVAAATRHHMLLVVGDGSGAVLDLTRCGRAGYGRAHPTYEAPAPQGTPCAVCLASARAQGIEIEEVTDDQS